MSITPIEVLSMATKSQEASLLKQVEHQKPLSEQVAIASDLKEQLQRNSEQTKAPTKSEYPEYRYDAKEKGNNPYYNQSKKKEKKKTDSDKKDTLNNQHRGIDIRI